MQKCRKIFVKIFYQKNENFILINYLEGEGESEGEGEGEGPSP